MRKKSSATAPDNEKNGKRRAALVAIGLGIIGTGGVLASAASLGVSTTGSLGTGVQVIASCDDDGVNVEYLTDFSTATGRYDVVAVKITGIAPACVERNLKITLRRRVPGIGSDPATYQAIATGSATLNDYDVNNVFTGQARVNVTVDPSYDTSLIDSAAIVIA